MSETKKPTVDEILEDLISVARIDLASAYETEKLPTTYLDNRYNDIKAALRTFVAGMLDEVIGENFVNWGELTTKEQGVESDKNDLRAQQRATRDKVLAREFGDE